MRKAFVLISLFACSKPATVSESFDAEPQPGRASTASAAPSLVPTPTPTPAGATADGGGCGTKALPCPLQGWMKLTMNPAMDARDFDGLGAAFDKLGTFAPTEPGYSNWTSISKDGARTARAADMGAVRAACRGCHEQYKAKYRSELRARPIPPA